MRRKRAQFGQVVSGYVDPTPEGLDKAYDRHMDNLLMNAAIRTEANQLNSAPFEGDREARRQLLDNTDRALTSITDSASSNYGNLSNMTAAVTRASAEYQKGSQPIKQNLENYTAYKSELDELLKNKRIDAEDYEGSLDLSTLGYNGFSYDEAGNAINMFEGVKAWQIPDIQNRIRQALQGLKPDSVITSNTILGGEQDGMVTLKTASGTTQVSEEKVRAALQGVMNDPEVLGYYGRKGEIKAARMDEPNLRQEIARMMDDESKSSNPDPEKVGRLSQALEAGNIEEMRQIVSDDIRDNILGTITDGAVEGNSFRQTSNTTDRSYDELWMTNYKQKLADESWKMRQDYEAAQAAKTAKTTEPVTPSQPGFVITEDGIVYRRRGGEYAGELHNEITAVEAELEELLTLYENPQNQLSAEGRESLERQIEDKATEARMLNITFQDLYKDTPQNLLDNDSEWEALQEDEPFSFTGVGAAGGVGILQTLRRQNKQKREKRDFLMQEEYASPVGESTVISTTYVDPMSLGLTKAQADQMDAFFEAGIKPTQMVLDPVTGQTITYKEWKAGKDANGDRRPQDLVVKDVAVSYSAPIGGQPTVRLSMANKDGQSASLLVPVGKGSYFDIPGLSQYYDNPGAKLVSELLTYKHEGLTDIDMNDGLKWVGEFTTNPSDPAAPKVQQGGYITADLTTSEGGTISIYNAQGELINTVGLLDPRLQTFAKLYNIKLTI